MNKLSIIILILLIPLPSIVEPRSLEINVYKKRDGSGTIFFGKTNFPDGTKLGISLEKDGKQGGQDFNIYVKNGKYESSAFTSHGLVVDENYEMTLFTYFNKLWQQPGILEKLKAYESIDFYPGGVMGPKFQMRKKLKNIETVK